MSPLFLEAMAAGGIGTPPPPMPAAPATPHPALPPALSEPSPPGTRRLLAVVLPQLLCELGQRLHSSPRACAPPQPDRAKLKNGVLKNGLLKSMLGRKADLPRAIVLVDALTHELDGRTELDAVNATAYQQGIRPRQMLAQARASVESLVVQPVLHSDVQAALAHLAEMLLRFGSPVSFRAPDTIWVDVTGSHHLHASEQELALEVLAQIRAMGHAARVAVAPGPWLARAFAQHFQPAPTGTLLVTPEQATRYVGELPIIALPIQREAVTWFARLGLLSIDDLKKLPASSLAGRLEGQVTEGSVGDVLDLLRGHDSGMLVPHHPEEAPREEQFWEDPLEASEPLLFVLKGLAGRLSARLEGRGQAARELLLTLHYDRSLAALATPEGQPAPHSKSLSFKLATPLFHADDLERVMRLRLQRQKLLAPTLGLSLQASAVTEAHHSQMALSETAAWKCGISTDTRALTVLFAELSADIGAASVGRLITQDSHLLEKSCWLQPISGDEPTNTEAVREPMSAGSGDTDQGIGCCLPLPHQRQAAEACPTTPAELCLPQLPTRLLQPALEIHAPLRKQELWIIGGRAFIVQEICFEQRLESVEWWECNRVFRDYYRVWLTRASARTTGTPLGSTSGWRRQSADDVSGLEALVYRDRERGKSYLHALFD